MAEPHQVADGECMLNIARQHGFVRWQSLYYHPDNKDLRAKRPDPNLLAKGDVVNIPEPEDREEYCETGKTHYFQLRAPKPVEIRLLIRGAGSVPLQNRRYEIEYTGEKGEVTEEGFTSPDGELRHPMPPEVKDAELRVWATDETEDDEPLVWKVKVGDLDPEETVTGIQDRLTNLGYDLGDEDGQMGDMTKAAIARFQSSIGLDPTGNIDEPAATRKELMERTAPQEYEEFVE